MRRSVILMAIVAGLALSGCSSPPSATDWAAEYWAGQSSSATQVSCEIWRSTTATPDQIVAIDLSLIVLPEGLDPAAARAALLEVYRANCGAPGLGVDAAPVDASDPSVAQAAPSGSSAPGTESPAASPCDRVEEDLSKWLQETQVTSALREVEAVLLGIEADAKAGDLRAVQRRIVRQLPRAVAQLPVENKDALSTDVRLECADDDLVRAYGSAMGGLRDFFTQALDEPNGLYWNGANLTELSLQVLQDPAVIESTRPVLLQEVGDILPTVSNVLSLLEPYELDAGNQP